MAPSSAMPEFNDFYEPHKEGRSFTGTSRLQFNPWFESNSAKKYYLNASYFVGIKKQFRGRNQEFNFSHRYRFNDKFSLRQDLYYNPNNNDAGFYRKYFETDGNGNSILKDIIFSRRDRKTVENVISVKYNFNNRSGITFRARHYWSKVEQKQLYDLQSVGSLLPTAHANVEMVNQNSNFFNIDAVYTLQFAPGSFINIVWKNSIEGFDNDVHPTYFKNFSYTISNSQNNNLSLKVLYYLDYLDIKKWKKKEVK